MLNYQRVNCSGEILLSSSSLLLLFFPEFHGIHQECVETLCMITHEHHYWSSTNIRRWCSGKSQWDQTNNHQQLVFCSQEWISSTIKTLSLSLTGTVFYFTPRSRNTQPQLMSPAVSWRVARTENDKHSSCSALTLHRRCAARPGNAFALDRCTNWRVNWRKLFPRDINLTPGSQRKVQHDAACRYLPGFSINWPIANRPERGYLDVHPSSNSAKTQCIIHFKMW